MRHSQRHRSLSGSYDLNSWYDINNLLLSCVTSFHVKNSTYVCSELLVITILEKTTNRLTVALQQTYSCATHISGSGLLPQLTGQRTKRDLQSSSFPKISYADACKCSGLKASYHMVVKSSYSFVH